MKNFICRWTETRSVVVQAKDKNEARKIWAGGKYDVQASESANVDGDVEIDEIEN